MDRDLSTDEDSSEEYEDSDDSLEIIANSMQATSICPIEPDNTWTVGTDNVLQHASRDGFSKLLCLMSFHAGCKPFDTIPLLCLLMLI